MAAAAAWFVKKEVKVTERNRKARQVKWVGDDCMFSEKLEGFIQTITGNGSMILLLCSRFVRCSLQEQERTMQVKGVIRNKGGLWMCGLRFAS